MASIRMVAKLLTIFGQVSEDWQTGQAEGIYTFFRTSLWNFGEISLPGHLREI